MKHIIWTNELDYEVWKDDLEEWYPSEEGYDEDARRDLMYRINNDYFDDEKVTLNKEIGNIVLIADLGLWDGRSHTYRHIGTNLNNIFDYFCGDYLTWLVDGDEVKCKDVHHDGTNIYTYRLIKGLSKFEFDEYAYEKGFKEAFEKYTEPIGHYVTEIYGIEVPK